MRGAFSGNRWQAVTHNNNRIASIVVVGGGSAGWMAAAALATYLGRQATVRLVESEEIGIVGVGEASVPHIKRFNAQTLGIDEVEFVKRTQATAKLGIEFNDWGRIGDRYIHGFGVIGRSMGPLPFHQFWLKLHQSGRASGIGDYSPQTVMAPRGRFAPGDRNAGPNSPLADVAYAYHFDAGLYARYLRELSERRGVQRIEGKVVRVNQRGEDGFVESVVLESGQVVEGELFIDCSGFRGLLIEQTLKTGYVDWTHWLPCDRAMAVPSESVDPITPYTRSTARTAGWQWRIPLQHRTGNGHVFASAFSSEAAARETLLHNLDAEPLAEPRLIKFRTGRRKQAWMGNCVAIGLSSGFLEPLESTSLHLIQTAVLRLIDLFPAKGLAAADIAEYNRQVEAEMVSVRDFILLHYKLTRRIDTPFWRHCRALAVPASLQARMDLFASHGRLFRHGQELFSEPSWLQVLLGQGGLPRGHHPLAATRPLEQTQAFVDDVHRVVQRCVAVMPTHAEFISAHCAAPAARP